MHTHTHIGYMYAPQSMYIFDTNYWRDLVIRGHCSAFLSKKSVFKLYLKRAGTILI